MKDIEDKLLASLVIDENNYITHQENDYIEFKNFFNWEDKRSKAKYLKFISAAANNKGGYLIFGIESDNKIIGDVSFKSIDIERLTQQINSYFIPKVNFNMFLLPLNSIICSILYVHEFEELPIICAENVGIQEEKNGKSIYINVLNKGDIYYRYAGTSEKILPNDLIQLFIKTSNKIINKKEIEQKEHFRKSDMKPLFKIQGNAKHQAQITFAFSLESELVHIIKCEELEKNEYWIQTNWPLNFLLQKGSILKVPTSHKKGHGYNENGYYNFGILMNDKDGRPYTLKISGNHQSSPQFLVVDGHL